MERRVTVNDGIERVELEIPGELDALEAIGESKPAGGEPVAAPYGPCLHFGPRGERCSLPAVAGGYCARHHNDPELRMPGRNYTRVLVATVALVMIVWPYIAEVARDLVRWVASLR
jgi:hypothetical protein